MNERVRVIWSEEFAQYDFGQLHPMSPIRLELTARLAEQCGLFADANVVLGGVPVGSDELLETVHDAEFVAAVHAASNGIADVSRGLGTEDDPIFDAIHDSSARIVQGSVEVAEQVWAGNVGHGVNVCGGMHHAMPDRASGFCVYNDIAVAIRRLLDLGAERVAYIDLDAHHGDGVQHVFWNDPRVLTISIHESGDSLFPGGGFPAETGGPDAPGSVVNIALPPGVSDGEWLRAYDGVVPAVVRAFKPSVIVSQHGCDTHFRDPLAHLRVSIEGQRQAAQMVHDLAHELCDGKWVAVGGGGYEIVDVVPIVWTHLIAIALHRPIDADMAIAQPWRDHVEAVWGGSAPSTMGDGSKPRWRPWSEGYDPGSPIDVAVMGTRRSSFEYFDLDPLLD